MQQAVGEAVRQQLQRLFGGHAGGQLLARLGQRVRAGRLPVRAQLQERLLAVAGLPLFDEARGLQLDDGFGLFGGLAPAAAVVLDHPLQVVDRVEEHVAQSGHVVRDVAGHRQVQQQHRPVPAGAQRLLDLGAMQDGRARGGGGNDHVGFRQVPVQLCQRQRDAAMAAGQVLRVRQGAVGDEHALRLGLGQVARGQFDGFAGADQQHGGFVQAGEVVLRQPHCDGRHRYRIGADAGVGAGALGGGEGLLEQPVQLSAQRPGLARGGPCLFDLAQNLRLAQHQRIQPAGDPEQVAHGVGVAVPVQVAVQGVARLGMRGQPVGQRSPVAFRVRIQLGAVAGRQQHRLMHARQRAQRCQRRRQRVRGERHPLAQGNRRGLVVDAEDVQAHGAWQGLRCATDAFRRLR